ncbi:hypothetical protein E2C01_014376 [Portunus trituberculatus]|uniref:Uncharacterized protein n=1 Tax=Portunus trituberculatus TaxID=210409 RepID=A0A5B7DIM9_PORTR|nr:hypothetical protein [Portunus trituberculatus]
MDREQVGCRSGAHLSGKLRYQQPGSQSTPRPLPPTLPPACAAPLLESGPGSQADMNNEIKTPQKKKSEYETEPQRTSTPFDSLTSHVVPQGMGGKYPVEFLSRPAALSYSSSASASVAVAGQTYLSENNKLKDE